MRIARIARIALLAAIGAAAAMGQPACTQIAQTLYQNGGARPVPMNGTITLSSGYTAQDGSGFVVVQSEAPIQIVAGKLSTCPAPGAYEANYTVNPIPPLNKTVQFTRYWTVPLTGGPYKLTDIPAGAVGPIEGQVFAPPAPQTFAVGATGATGAQGPSGTGNAPFSETVTSLTTLTVAAATHGQGATVVGYCWNSAGPIGCQSVPDSFGNITFTWPGGFTGGITILGGGSGPRGATGAQGPQGIQGPPGVPTPPATGVYCLQTSNGAFVYTGGICGSVSGLYLSTLANSDVFNLTNFQLSLLTNGVIVPLSLSSITNGQLAALSNLQLALLSN